MDINNWRQDTQHNDTRQNDTQHEGTGQNDTQHEDTGQNDTQYNYSEHFETNQINNNIMLSG